MTTAEFREISLISARPVYWPAAAEAPPKDGQGGYAVGRACLIFIAVHLVVISTAVLIFATN
jgi:hypothetical protein